MFWLTMLNRVEPDLEPALVLTKLETQTLDRLIPDPTAHPSHVELVRGPVGSDSREAARKTTATRVDRTGRLYEFELTRPDRTPRPWQADEVCRAVGPGDYRSAKLAEKPSMH